MPVSINTKAAGVASEWIQSGEWVPVRSIFVLLLDGIGDCTIDVRDPDGAITESVESYTNSGALTDQYPYLGPTAVEARHTFTNSCRGRMV